ncbi:MAG: PhoU domain-containing protein [Candidatus Omnitrophota bacterium]
MDMNGMKEEVAKMAGTVYSMLGLIEKGFMENKPEPLAAAMKEEKAINGMEKELTGNILVLSKASGKCRGELAVLAGVIEMLERMGDEALNLVERIEIKVEERLLFSDLGVAQFNETYDAMKRSVEMMVEFLKSRKPALKERVIDNGFHVKDLVERYRREHMDRFVKGLCTPMSANMYFDMLDFTGNLARHSSNIVKLFE